MSENVSVTFVDGDGKQTSRKVGRGSTFIDAAQDLNLDIAATCGGRGRCRSCRIKVLKGILPPPTIMDQVQLGPDEVHEGFRLSCQTKVIADCTVLVAPPIAEGGHKILGAGVSEDTQFHLDSGIEKKLVAANTPKDENHQTSDMEMILVALGEPVNGDVPIEVLRKAPDVIRAKGGSLTVTTFNHRVIDVEPGDTTRHKYGMAFDIGTTSIVGSLVDLETGEQLASVGGVNPQAVFGGDLMSRIAYAQFNPQALRKLRSRVLAEINGYVKEVCGNNNISAGHIYKMVIVGNTCMHHIFLGIDPTYVGLAPYAPTVREPVVVTAKEALLKVNPNARICFLPIVAGFVGADTVAAVLATRIHESDHIRVMVDIGTNGEVVMGTRGRLMACSAPAGPALEGAQIHHGMRGAVGAIEKVEIDGDVTCETIGGAPAVGICGSGLVDAAAKMLEAKVINPSGLLRRDGGEGLPEKIKARIVEGDNGWHFVLTWAKDTGKDEDIYLTQQDIRQLQLAKGAIYSGILMLQKVMGVADGDIEELMLAGGFGNYISTESSVAIRLLPNLPLEKIAYVGNAAALGAQMALLSETERRRATTLAREIEHVALATNPDFQEIFVKAVVFGDETKRKSRTRTRTKVG